MVAENELRHAFDDIEAFFHFDQKLINLNFFTAIFIDPDIEPSEKSIEAFFINLLSFHLAAKLTLFV